MAKLKCAQPTRSETLSVCVWGGHIYAGLYLPSNIFAGYDSHLYDLYPAVDFAGYKNVLPSNLNVDR